jgi:hypothetical protein
MIELLKIEHPDLVESNKNESMKDKIYEWSPLDICEGKF